MCSYSIYDVVFFESNVLYEPIFASEKFLLTIIIYGKKYIIFRNVETMDDCLFDVPCGCGSVCAD